jgi:hypothetical protein
MRPQLRALVPAVAVMVLALATYHGPPAPPLLQSWKVVGWNNLGMHCMDSDYGVFSILPPYNVLDAQVIQPDGHLLTAATGYAVTYEAVADPTGSINRTSQGKTSFWQHAGALYGGSAVPDTGLAGFDMPGPANVPKAMAFGAASHVFTADGVPITPYDDAGHKRPYPMMKVTVRTAAGAELAATNVVLPVSDEMDCRLCHESGAPAAAQPAQGWVFDPNPERDYRLNILRRHDARLGSALFDGALNAAGYSASGLYDTVVTQGTPILCARCHASNALPGTGMRGISPLTSAVHGGHAGVVDPLNGLTLDQSQNRAACYRCHPGSETRCLRGAMGAAVAPDGSLAIQCQSCHGSMSAVGNPSRVGWLQEPSCQNCHTGNALVNSGQIRYANAFLPNGQPRQPADPTFATNPNTPAPGFDLYRFSAGHGGLRCEACHGATHAEYPALHQNDNVQSQTFQGHVGVLAECTACHASSPVTENGGPHGMHPIGQPWVADHHDYVEEGSPMDECRACHGADLKGTVLSLAQADRTFSTNWGTKTYFRGSIVSCWGCHDGPDSSDPPPNLRGTAQNATLSATTAPVQTTLAVNDPDAGQALSYRIVRQPAHGTVALAGTQATYFPEPGFAGPDPFTFAAFDGYLDSTLGTVTVVRGAGWSNYGKGYPGTAGAIPALTLSAAPQLGATVVVQAQNTSGAPAPAFLVVSAEPASIPTNLGGVVLVEPTSPLAFTLPAGGLNLAWAVPSDPALTGIVLHAQIVQADPGALFGWAFSRGLRVVPGP